MFNAANTKISDLVLITSFGENSYGATIEECLLIPKSFYNENIQIIKNFNFTYVEIDGKYSSVEAKICIFENLNIEELSSKLSKFGDMQYLIDHFASKIAEIKSNEIGQSKYSVLYSKLYSDLNEFKEQIEEKVNSELEILNETEQSLMTKILELAETAEDKDIINKLINSNRVMKHLIKYYNSIK